MRLRLFFNLLKTSTVSTAIYPSFTVISASFVVAVVLIAAFDTFAGDIGRKELLNSTNLKHHVRAASNCIVLVLIKLTKFAVALRLRSGSCKLIFDIIS